jgi:molecular chaperone GrpE
MNEENTTNDQNLSEEEKPVTDTKNENTSVSETDQLKKQVAELNDKYLRLYSEFDNYRKRTIKEKSELIKTASEDVLKSVLPILDDFERAMKANENVAEVESVKEGILLIYNKLKHNTQSKGLTAFDSIGLDFNADTMEAITHIPATEDAQKGKVVDEIEKGYKLGDKVIRYAKVVVAN